MGIVHLPRYSELPDIDLYADQVLSYLNTHLSFFQLDPSKPLITGTMINNYVKAKVVPAPVKKKYSREHLAFIFVIVILKNVYSLVEIQDLIDYQLKFDDVEGAYDRFCNELEICIEHSFKQQNYVFDSTYNEGHKLLIQVCTSVSHKLYVERVIYDWKKTHPEFDGKKKKK